MGNESCSEALGGVVGNTEMGYQQQLMLHIALQTVKNATEKKNNFLLHQIAMKNSIVTFKVTTS